MHSTIYIILILHTVCSSFRPYGNSTWEILWLLGNKLIILSWVWLMLWVLHVYIWGVCKEKLKTHWRRKEEFAVANLSTWQVFSTHKQRQPINLWHPGRIGVSIAVDSRKYRSLVPFLMTGFMDWICKSSWMLSDLQLKHNSLLGFSF